MAWIELHQALPQHRKLLALRDALPACELAAALRTSGFVDADRRLHDWGDYTGRLIDQRAANRERQRRRRARLRAAAMKESKEDGT